ncbi:MAG: XdhC family protein [Bacteroidota bacterium]|nr:XdhC family protein [Bacteroidota bacterium]
MKEINHLINAFEEAKQMRMQTALVTVVHVEGSSYRRAGARMLVREDGQIFGAISGGCLEGDALRKAMLVLSQQQTKLVTYDTSDEEDAAIGLQLGCEGIIQVLFEPINDQKKPVELLKKAVSVRQHAVLITLFSLEDKRNKQVGTSLLLEENGNVSGKIDVAELKNEIVKDAKSALQQKKSVFKTYTTENNSVTAFIEFLKPPVSLIIIGAGNDALPVTQIADLLGWEVRVVDGRTTHAKPERFVSACQVLVCNPENVLEEIPVDSNTAFVLMTHNYNYDKAMLKALLQKQVEYIGVLGPKKKLKKMLDELKDEGVELPDNHLKKIYGPAGLEIGSETPEEIALSIIAEIKSVFSKKEGGSLRNKKDVIHSRKETLIESKELP